MKTQILLILTTLITSLHVHGQCDNTTACNFNDGTLDPCAFPGDDCDDGNSFTVNDKYSNNCQCEGVPDFSLVGCTNTNACNFNVNAQVDDGSCLFLGGTCDDGNSLTFNDMVNDDCECEGAYDVRLVLFDSAGNGWNGAIVSITNSDGTNSIEFNLSGGFEEDFLLNLPPGCYEISATDDEDPTEISYFLEVQDEFGNQDVFGYADQTQIFSVGGIAGCTDPTAQNYDFNANCDSGDCYYCVEDGECTFDDQEGLQPALCNSVRICGKGLYNVSQTSHSGYLNSSTTCRDIAIATNPAGYLIRIRPDFGEVMTVTYNGVTKGAPGGGGHDHCFYIDFDSKKLVSYIWDKSRTVITMNDDEEGGWSGSRYQIINESADVIADGTLTESQFNDGATFGFDEYTLDDGCYFLMFYMESNEFNPNHIFRIDNIDQGFVCGEINGNPIPFSINSELCTMGCTDPEALNYNPGADVPCFGTNACCVYPPVNDECDDATVIEAGVTYNWGTTYASTSDHPCNSDMQNDIWFEYTPTCDEMLSFSGCSEQGFLVCIYEGACPESDSSVALHSGNPNGHYINQAPILALNGVTYYFRISSDASISTTGNGIFKLDNFGCRGCIDESAYNTDDTATFNDHSCLYPGECAGDLNGDGMVTSADLSIFLGSFANDCTE